MKRALRVVLLGPIFLVALTAVTIVYPLALLITWLCDDPVTPAAIGSLWADAAVLVWSGV